MNLRRVDDIDRRLRRVSRAAGVPYPPQLLLLFFLLQITPEFKFAESSLHLRSFSCEGSRGRGAYLSQEYFKAHRIFVWTGLMPGVCVPLAVLLSSIRDSRVKKEKNERVV